MRLLKLVYSILIREITKFQLGMHRGLNDSYATGLEFINLKDIGFSCQLKEAKFYAKRYMMNTLTKLSGIKDGNLIVAVLFKVKPDPQLKSALYKEKFTFTELPENPYS